MKAEDTLVTSLGDVDMAIQIIEILGRSIQGVTHPFRCRCESGEVYYVIPSTVDSCQLSAMLFHSTENRLCEIHRKVVRQQFAHFVNHSIR